ncbi:MAG: hypothetical protein ACRC62_05630 [Microcoleus sp.]
MMANQVLFKNTAGRITVAPAYFASIKHGSLLGERWKPVDVRAARALVYKSCKCFILKAPEFIHLLKNATDLSGATIAADSRSLDTANPISIDGIAVQPGDQIEIQKTQATTLKISPGIWEADTQTHIRLVKAPIYTATAISNFGYGWRYRIDTNGDLIGLVQFIPTNIVTAQTRPSVPVNHMDRLLDTNFYSLVDMGHASYQGMSATFDSVPNVRRIALAASSARYSFDTSFPSAYFDIQCNGTKINSEFTNIGSRSKYESPWSNGNTETYSTNITDREVHSFTVYDASGSRAFVSLEICVDGASQIFIKGDAPTNGSQIIISESVASAFFPVISAGTYDVIENSGSDQWRLRKV